MRGVSADDAIAEVARQGHRVSQVDDLPSGENHAPSLDSSSLPPNESAAAPALFRHVTPAHRVSQVDDLPSGENHAPSLDSSSLPPNESAAAPALFRHVTPAHRVSQVADLPSAENHAPSLDSSSLPPNENAAAPALFRHVTPAHRVSQVADLPSVENHAPSLDSSSLPPNESVGAAALFRRAILGRTLFAVLTLVALLTAGYTLGISGDFEKLYSSLSKVDSTPARKELADAVKRLEANEKEWAAKLNAERERSNGLARDLAAARAELADRVNAETASGADAQARSNLIPNWSWAGRPLGGREFGVWPLVQTCDQQTAINSAEY